MKQAHETTRRPMPLPVSLRWTTATQRFSSHSVVGHRANWVPTAKSKPCPECVDSPGRDSNPHHWEEGKDAAASPHRHRARSWDAFDLLTEMVARLVRTNLLVKGWVSTDRSEVAALLITTPRPRTKSSTNDLTPPRRMGWISLRPPPALIGRAVETSCCGSTGPRRRHRQNQRRRASAISLPPDEGVRKISSHIRAGFWLRGVQP